MTGLRQETILEIQGEAVPQVDAAMELLFPALRKAS